jgi:hypothetical protein
MESIVIIRSLRGGAALQLLPDVGIKGNKHPVLFGELHSPEAGRAHVLVQLQQHAGQVQDTGVDKRLLPQLSGAEAAADGIVAVIDVAAPAFAVLDKSQAEFALGGLDDVFRTHAQPPDRGESQTAERIGSDLADEADVRAEGRRRAGIDPCGAAHRLDDHTGVGQTHRDIRRDKVHQQLAQNQYFSCSSCIWK